MAIKKVQTNSQDYTVHQNVGVGLHYSSSPQEINNSICDEDEHGDKSKSLRRKTMRTCKLPWYFFSPEIGQKIFVFLSIVRPGMKSGLFFKIPVNMIKKLS